MLDSVGAVFVAAYLLSILSLILAQARRTSNPGGAMIFIAAWGLLEVAIYSAARAGFVGSVPPNILMFTASLTLFSVVWAFAPSFRRAGAQTPVKALLSLHIWRIGGLLFLVLYAEARLPAPFAPIAAVGDMITGVAAAMIVISEREALNRRILFIWNAFGFADLIAAVGLASLSIEHAPFQLFPAAEGEFALASLPWMLVPAVIVPALLFSHLVIFLKLRSPSREQFEGVL